MYSIESSILTALALALAGLDKRDFAAAVKQADPTVRRLTSDGLRAPRKVAGRVPHDLGCPSEAPWRKINAYNFQDVGRWKDLGPKVTGALQKGSKVVGW